MRRLLSITIVAAALVAAAVLAGATTSQKTENRTYRIVFDNTFGLVEGGDFRVGGVRAGKTSTFDVQKRKGQPAKAVAIAEISEPGFADFRKDATCEILPQSLIGEYYVDCQPGQARERLPTDGTGTVPVNQTSSTIPADLVGNVMRRPYRERFRLILSALGSGLAGRPEDLQEVVRRAHPGLRETSRVLRILGNQNRIIENFVADSDTVIEELEGNKRDVVRWIREAGDAAAISASRRAELAESFRLLPGFLGELEPTMARLGQLADEQTPLLRDLQRAAPDLNTFFTRLGPFSEASRPALRSLGKAGVKGRRAFLEGAREVDVLRRLARDLPASGRAPHQQGVARPFRQFLQTLDDRRRAAEDDERARESGPPAPDPTHVPSGRAWGFTGMEALWDYFFWQALTINSADDIGHVLKLSLILNDCRKWRVRRDPSDRSFDRCRQWLGPYQPGINAPDPTESGTAVRSVRSDGRGAPEVRAPRGSADASRPPDARSAPLEALLPDLERPPSPAPQEAAPGSPNRSLLDFLLAP